MENRKLKKIIAIILIAIAFLLATLIITSSIIKSLHLGDNNHAPIMSYETYKLSTNQNYTPTSGDTYVLTPEQEDSTTNNPLVSNNTSILESATNSSVSSFISSVTNSETSKKNNSYSQKQEALSSSASYNTSSESEYKTQVPQKTETTTQQNEQQTPVHEHSYMERVISPNCTSKGYTLHSCDCGKSYADNYKNALGHQWGDWETLSEATVTSKGLQQKTCLRCSAKDYRYTEKITINNSPNSDFAEEVIKLINEERKKNGVAPLKIDNTLMNNAYTRSTELETNFGHQRPNGEQGYTFALKLDYSIVGENIAAGQTSPKEVVDSWMSSAGHRSNILNPEFTNTGVGCYMASDGWIYWTQLFGG